MEFITDRTANDVTRLKQLWAKGYRNLTPGELAEWEEVAARGSYNYTDLNRVETAVSVLAKRMGLITHTKTDWTNKDIPTEAEMERYLKNLRSIYRGRYSDSQIPSYLKTMENLSYKNANYIEDFLKSTDTATIGSGGSVLGEDVLGGMVLGGSYPEPDVSFETAPWPNIRYVLESDNISDYWNIGDSRKITIVLRKSKPISVQWVDFKICSIEDHAITLITTKAIPFNTWCPDKTPHSLLWTTWAESDVRTEYNTYLYDGLPLGLQELVVDCENTTDGKLHVDKVWIPSASEVESWFPTEAARHEFFESVFLTRDYVILEDSSGEEDPLYNYIHSQTASVVAMRLAVS